MSVSFDRTPEYSQNGHVRVMYARRGRGGGHTRIAEGSAAARYEHGLAKERRAQRALQIVRDIDRRQAQAHVRAGLSWQTALLGHHRPEPFPADRTTVVQIAKTKQPGSIVIGGTRSDYKRVYSGGARSRLVLCADGRAQTRGDWRCGASAKADNALVGDHHNLNDASTRRHERSTTSSTRRRAHFLEGRFWDALRVLALHDVIRCVAIRRAIPRNVTCRQAMRNGRNHLLVPR